MAVDKIAVLTTAIREGNIEKVNNLIESSGLANSVAWSDGYVLFREAIDKNHIEIAKVILTNIKTEIDSNRLALTPDDRDALNSIVNIDKLTTLQAVINGDVDTLQILLDKDEDNRDLYVKALLHVAIRNNKMAIVELLLKYGADLNFKSEGLTPLHVAINENCVRIAEYLIINGARVHSGCFIDRDRCTPLKLAIIMGRDILVKILLENGAKIDSRNNNTFRLAFKKGHSIIAAYIFIWSLDLGLDDRRKLMDSVACLEDEYRTIFRSSLKDCQYDDFGNSATMLALLAHAAVKTGCIKVLQFFVNFGLDVNASTVHKPQSPKCQTFLHSAVKNFQMDMIEYLIQIGADVNVVNDDEKSPIFYAITYGNAKITRLLLRCRARMMNDAEFLPNAAGRGNRELVEILLEHDPDIDIYAKDRSGNTALHNAIENCHSNKSDNKTNLEFVEFLLNRGADVNARGRMDSRPLHFAVWTGCIELVETLLARDAEVNATCGAGETPLHGCVSRTNGDSIVAMVKLLLTNNADISAKNNRGQTALHHASRRGNTEIVELLLMHGAEINARSLHGMTPLHSASLCNANQRQTIGLLLKNGSDINAIDDEGKTPLNYIIKGRRFPDRRNRGLTSEVVDIFYQEIIKRKVANLYVCEQNLTFVERAYYRWFSFEESCKREIVEMRGSKISRNISIYDILSKNVHDISIYAKYRIVVKTLESEDRKVKFPIYCDLISNYFKKAQMREALLNPSVKSFNYLIGHEFFDILTIEIFRYLSDEDLKNLIKARQNSCSNELTDSCEATHGQHSLDKLICCTRESRKRQREESPFPDK